MHPAPDPWHGIEPASPSGVCPSCGLLYDDFRTGLTYQDVYAMLWRDSEDPENWRNKSRHGVLGFWRETKLIFWGEHTRLCSGGGGDARKR